MAHNNLVPSMAKIIWQCNISEKDVDSLPISITFWKDVLIARWQDLQILNFNPPLSDMDNLYIF